LSQQLNSQNIYKENIKPHESQLLTDDDDLCSRSNLIQVRTSVLQQISKDEFSQAEDRSFNEISTNLNQASKESFGLVVNEIKMDDSIN
jgi:hypothetical protein